jgi:hypothetical protein
MGKDAAKTLEEMAETQVAADPIKDKAAELTSRFPQLNIEMLCAAFSEAIEFGRNLNKESK